MSFSPTFSKYINFNTASYIEPSSSIGPTGIDTLMSNQEWLYHGVNSQVLINSNYLSNVYFFTTSLSDINVPKFYKSFGPVRLNLNKLGQPQPMFLAFKGGVLELVGPSEGIFTFVFNSQGTNNQTLDWLSLTSSFQGREAFSLNYQVCSGSYIDSEGFIFASTSSVSTTPNNPLTALLSKTSKTSGILDSSQLTCMMNLSVFWTQTSCSVGASAYPHIDALYLREVNPYL